MGGDGGTISSNRTYLRGAGKACHTADHPSNALKRAKLEDAERARLTMTTCAVSGAVLDISPAHGSGGSVGGVGVVACPYGRLYKRENALEALLRRSQGAGDDNKTAPLGTYIRGMKDLYPVRFHVVPTSNGEGGYIAACPITGSEIGNGNIASYLIVRTKSKDKKKNGDTDEVDKNPNVLSERAVKEMGMEGLQAGRCGCGLQTAEQFTNFRMSKPATSTVAEIEDALLWNRTEQGEVCSVLIPAFY